MPTIFDNIENCVVEALNNTLEVSHRSDFCVGYFNLRGWKQVSDNIDKWSGEDENRCRLLVGMQKMPQEQIRDFFALHEEKMMDVQEASRLKKELALQFREQLTVGIPTEADEIGLRKLARQIKEKKVIVKLFLRHPLHAKLYLLFRDDKINPIIGYLGSSNLTLSGLAKQGELNIDVLDRDATEKLARWFEDRWNDKWCIDISEELAEIIDTSWAGDHLLSPYHIYLKMAYHLSREAIAGMSEFRIPKNFENELLEFQQKAVLVAAHHLNKRDGVVIGDVVGLGKTITACALARIFEDDFFLETLILCPRNIVTMWEDYVHKYRLHAKVLPYSLVQKELPNLRRYRLLILDESHNLRNREGKRYRAIQEYIQLNGSKVILLSATPYNKTFLDLSSQLRLFVGEDTALRVSPELYIESIGGKVQFTARHQVPIRSLAAFERSNFIDDWREIMRLYLVRRTRSFIKQNYAQTDPTNGRKYLVFPDGSRSYFPTRTPKKVEYTFDKTDPSDQYARLYSEEVVAAINRLNLPRYGLGNYVNENSKVKPSAKEEVIIANLSRAGKRLKGFCRTNLFKRLESSGYSFLLSVSRQILRNFIFVYAIDRNLPLPIGTQEVNMLDEFLDDDDLDRQGNNGTLNLPPDEKAYYDQAEKIYKSWQKKYARRFDWLRGELLLDRLIEDLLADAREALTILDLGRGWSPDKDRQLNSLHDLCIKKHNNEKLLIFTQFADTANYIIAAFHERGVERIQRVTGDTDDPTAIAYRFSPRSNERSVSASEELRILVTTDVLSEGQNLQDCHIVVNYDLPWALIRLIQRAGRVDRIGQQAEEILCYSFLPEDGIETIINLRRRLGQRIQENAEVVGSDETFFEGDPINIEDLYNENAGILEREDDGEVDLASHAYQIWKNATDSQPELKKIVPELPNVVYATKALDQHTGDQEGVLAWLHQDGRVVTQSQLAILKAAQCAPETPPRRKIHEHHQLVAKGIEHIRTYESDIGGQLGKKSSARYRAYMRLRRYYDHQEGTLFATGALKRAIDDIYKFPLKEYGRDALNRQMKAGVSDEDLATLVVSLREEDKLCVVREEKTQVKEPQIICSLGMKRV